MEHFKKIILERYMYITFVVIDFQKDNKYHFVKYTVPNPDPEPFELNISTIGQNRERTDLGIIDDQSCKKVLKNFYKLVFEPDPVFLNGSICIPYDLPEEFRELIFKYTDLSVIPESEREEPTACFPSGLYDNVADYTISVEDISKNNFNFTKVVINKKTTKFTKYLAGLVTSELNNEIWAKYNITGTYDVNPFSNFSAFKKDVIYLVNVPPHIKEIVCNPDIRNYRA